MRVLRAVTRPTLFERATARRLRLTRAAFGVLIGLRIALGPYPALADQPAALWQPVSFLRWLGVDAMPGVEVIAAVQVVGGSAAVAVVVGAFRRGTLATTSAARTARTAKTALAAAWLALLVLAALRSSTGKLLHNDVLLLIATAPLLFADAPGPEDDARHGRRYGWPFSVGLAAMCLTYFALGVAKLRNSGLAWVTGDNMRYVMLAAGRSSRPEFPEIARAIGRSAALSHVVAAAILGLELAFPLAYFIRRARPFFAAAAVALHAGTWLTLGLDYWLWAATAAILLTPTADDGTVL